MRKLIAAGLAAAALLTGCSEDAPPAPKEPALGKLSADEMCGLLPKADVEGAFADKSPRSPAGAWPRCRSPS